MNFPMIVVERPHQTRGRAWVAEEEGDITEKFHNAEYGDNWYWRRFENRQEAIEFFSEFFNDAEPEALSQLTCDGPVVITAGNGWYQAGPESSMPSLLDFSIEYIGHDFHMLDLLESRDEAEALLERGGHNVPYSEIRRAMERVGWCDEDEDEDEDEDDDKS